MKPRSILSLLFVILLLSGCSPTPAVEAEQASEDTPFVSEFFAMDTVMKLTIYGEDAQAASASAGARIQELEKRLSTTDETSEIYAANHSGGEPVPLSEDTGRLLERALDICEATRGMLDVTIYPVVKTWGFTTGEYRVPDQAELDGLLERVDYTRVSPEDHTLALPEGMEIDLGAVAKGYTGDELMALLGEKGVTSAIVELGGNVQALGTKPDGSPWRVAVQDPDGGYAAVLEIVDRAVVTSGGYQRYFEQDGETYWHIIDPATGYPAQSGLASVTIVADEGVLCDGLSTALFVMGADRAADFWRENGGFDFVLLGEDGGVTITEGLEDSFSLYGDWAGRAVEVVRQ